MERETIEKKDAYMIGDSNALHISSLIATDEMLGVGSSKWIKMILGGSGFKLVVKAETTHLSEQFE